MTQPPNVLQPGDSNFHAYPKPAKVKAGGRLNAPVCQTDLLATLAEMLGKSLPNNAGEDSNSFYTEMPSKY